MKTDPDVWIFDQITLVRLSEDRKLIETRLRARPESKKNKSSTRLFRALLRVESADGLAEDLAAAVREAGARRVH